MNAPRRRAVIDLGTNTFHLLIVDVAGPDITEVYRERRFVKLAAEGIETIGREPFLRGLDALEHYAGVLRDHDCGEVLAFGTAALRTASNAAEFVAAARERTGIQATIIPGEEEARLITKGVFAAIPPLEERVLIMDIGGGSTEFIIADADGVHFSRSFPVGVGVLTHRFHRTDPIAEEEIRKMHEHLEEVTEALSQALYELPATHLVGAAGTFEVLADLLRAADSPSTSTYHALSLEKFASLRDRIYASELAERVVMDGIPPERADMIVAAFVLLDYVFRKMKVRRVTVSNYAMKEGILLSSLS